MPFDKLPCFNTEFATKEGLDQHLATVHQQFQNIPNNENNIEFTQEYENQENIPNTSADFNNFDNSSNQMPPMQTPHESVNNQNIPFLNNFGNGGFTEEKSVLNQIDGEKRKLRCTICNIAEFLTGMAIWLSYQKLGIISENKVFFKIADLNNCNNINLLINWYH